MSLSPPLFESQWLGDGSHAASNWTSAFSPGIVVLLLLEGEVCFEWAPGKRRDLMPNQIIWLNTHVARPPLCHLRRGQRHQALVLRFATEWVQGSLDTLRQEMASDFQSLLLGPHPVHPMITRPLEAEDRAWARSLMASTLCAEARRLLEGSRMSEFFFRKVLMESRGEELFCTRTRRLALERVSRVREALLRDLENPPSLDELAQICGCNPQYLSRTFSETAGTTISLLLRRLRIERAAKLLSTGQMNASEAALEVGYRSLSHFSQAFRAEKGLSPSAWMRRPTADAIA